MGKNQVESQKMIIKQLKERNFQKIRSKIAMDITVYSSAKNPPRMRTSCGTEPLAGRSQVCQLRRQVNQINYVPLPVLTYA